MFAPTVIRRRKPSLAKSLIDSAVAFMGQAVNLQNATQVAHRHEQVAIAMATAWEKMLKAFLYKADPRSIYYTSPKTKRGEKKPKRKTLSLDSCLAEVHNKLGRAFEPSKMVVEQSGEYRNDCIHLYGERLDAILMPLFSQCCLYFSDFLKLHFNRELFSELELAILPIAYQRPFIAEDFLTTHNASAGASQEVKDFLHSLIDAGQRLYDSGHTDCVLVKYHLALVSVKSSSDADLVVHVNNAAPADETFRVERPVSGDIRLTSDRKAQIVRLSDDQIIHEGYTISYQKLQQLVKSQGYKYEKSAQYFVKQLEQDSSLCYVRYLDPSNLKSGRRCFYHVDAQASLIDYLTANGIQRDADKSV